MFSLKVVVDPDDDEIMKCDGCPNLLPTNMNAINKHRPSHAVICNKSKSQMLDGLSPQVSVVDADRAALISLIEIHQYIPRQHQRAEKKITDQTPGVVGARASLYPVLTTSRHSW